VNADTEKTQHHYSTVKPESLCDCEYCKNYYRQIKTAYPLLATYLASFGVDIEKPFELSPLEPDGNGILTYCACQYIVFGHCPDGYRHRVGDVTVQIALFYPDTGIQEEHFVLELSPVYLKLSINIKNNTKGKNRCTM